MKTAVIYYAGFLKAAGGAFMHVRAFSEELRARGWEVKIVTLDSLPLWCRYLPHAVRKAVGLFSLPKAIAYRGAVTRWLYRQLFHQAADLRVFEEIYVSWNSTTPSVTMLHATWSDNLQAFSVTEQEMVLLKQVEADLLNSISHPIVTVSEPYRRYLVDEHFAGMRLPPVEVVELGVRLGRFARSSVSRAQNSIIYVGALEARKNLKFLLEVFAKLHAMNPEYRLTLVGDGPQRGVLMDLASQQRLPVAFTGKLNHDAVIEELQRHEVYLHTSLKESFSFALLEAKLCGLVTCASSGLQVPREFIDIGLSSFDAELWTRAIIGRGRSTGPFDAARYSVEEMASRTLSLAGVS
jgi:glycosyltransferase involved in cell wall biosynthesis